MIKQNDSGRIDHIVISYDPQTFSSSTKITESLAESGYNWKSYAKMSQFFSLTTLFAEKGYSVHLTVSEMTLKKFENRLFKIISRNLIMTSSCRYNFDDVIIDVICLISTNYLTHFRKKDIQDFTDFPKCLWLTKVLIPIKALRPVFTIFFSSINWNDLYGQDRTWQTHSYKHVQIQTKEQLLYYL